MIAPASAVLAVHIAAGAVSLLTGAVALLTRKGGRAHRGAGKLFLIAMITIAGSALVLALLRPNPLLLFLAVFSGYLAVWGRVALARKSLAPRTPAPRAHYVPTIGFAVFLGYFVVVALRSGAPVFVSFAGLAVALVIGHLRRLRRGGEFRVHWLLDHQTGFVTAFIASITAVLVVNTSQFAMSSQWAAMLVWLGPTVIGVPLLIRSSRRLTAKERAARGAIVAR